MPDRKYTVVVTEKVRKILLKLSSSVATKIEKKLLELETDPRPSGYKKLKGRPGYRIRIGDYRVIYEIDDNVLKIIVIDLGHRRDIYR